MEHIFIKNFGINSIIGSISLAIISYFIFLRNIESIAKINNIIVPILISIIILIGTINILNLDINQIKTNLEINNNFWWWIEAIIYSSYNLILVIPVLINLKKFLKNKKQIRRVSVISAIIICVIALFTFYLLLNTNVNFSKIEMPVVYVIKNKFNNFNIIYGIIILMAIFTTAISIGIGFLNNICKNKKNFPQIALIMCITSILVSRIGFAKLIQTLFPLFGYLGIIQIIFIAISNHKKSK